MSDAQESVVERRRELSGNDPEHVIGRRLDYIIQSFSDLHAMFGRTRRRDTKGELEEMQREAESLEEAAADIQVAIDLYREHSNGKKESNDVE